MNGEFVKLILLIAGLWYFTQNPVVPPGPGPEPNPHIDPITATASVLIVEETADRQNLPESQIEILRGVPFREWMDSHKVAYRIWDQNVNPEHETKGWQDALKASRKSLPWIYITNGSKGFSGPLPRTVDDTQALIGKYL